MIRRLFACAALILSGMTGCASTPPPDVAAFQEWAHVAGEQAEAGQMPYSVYYTEAFSRLESSSDTSPYKHVLMRALNDIIPVARAYEAGQISADQFKDAQRATRLFIAEQNQNLDSQRQRAISEAMRQAGQNLRNSVPANTTCTESFGFVNCRTR